MITKFQSQMVKTDHLSSSSSSEGREVTFFVFKIAASTDDAQYIHNTSVFAVDSRLLLCSRVWAEWRQEEALRHSDREAGVQAGLSREVAP